MKLTTTNFLYKKTKKKLLSLKLIKLYYNLNH